MSLVSDYYRSVLEKEHANGEWGTASIMYAPRIAGMMKQYNQREILDYGAGAGNLEKALKILLLDVTVHNYEPGVPKWSASPSPCNMVACVDVIEHIEPDCLDDVLDDLKRVTLQYAFISIATRPANRILNNGWNAHICLKTPQEWKKIIENRFTILNGNYSNDSAEFELLRK